MRIFSYMCFIVNDHYAFEIKSIADMPLELVAQLAAERYYKEIKLQHNDPEFCFPVTVQVGERAFSVSLEMKPKFEILEVSQKN